MCVYVRACVRAVDAPSSVVFRSIIQVRAVVLVADSTIYQKRNIHNISTGGRTDIRRFVVWRVLSHDGIIMRPHRARIEIF